MKLQRGRRETLLLMIATAGTDPLEPGAAHFFQVSHVCIGVQAFYPHSTTFPGSQQGVRLKVKQLRLKLVTMWDASTSDRGLTWCILVQAPTLIIFGVMSHDYYLKMCPFLVSIFLHMKKIQELLPKHKSFQHSFENFF